jgi:uncharacterized membrane protein YbhN (UPF0104 family)
VTSLVAPIAAPHRLRVPRWAWIALGVAVLGALVATALPGAYEAVADGIGRIPHAHAGWLALALALEALSFLGHIILFRGVFLDDDSRVGYTASYEITMAGHAATRLFGAAGAGGVALQVWALRRSGISSRTVTARMIAFLVLLYSFYMVTVAVVGLGLGTGLLPGGGAPVLTLVPAALAISVIALTLGSGRLRRRLPQLGGRPGKALATLDEGVSGAFEIVRRRDPRLLGGLMWWAFDVAVLWACFHAFGASPAIAIVTFGYFLGLVGNALPFVGSLGGVDGGMIGALIALGTAAPVTIAAVVVYRLISCWLPTIPGLAAYLQLRRRMRDWEAAQDEAAEGATVTAFAPEPEPQAIAA